MLKPPHDADWRVVDNIGDVGTTTPGTAVTTGASSGTKGTATELISAANNDQDSWGIYIIASNVAALATRSEGSLDILIGGATDDILIPDLLIGNAGDAAAGAMKHWFFPLHVPKGVRIAAQACSFRTSTAIRVGVRLFGGASPPWRTGSKVVTYGVTAPSGVAVTPGASGGAQSETQITASTSFDHFAFLPSFQVGNDTTVQARNHLIGIGAGSATSEKIGQWFFTTDANENMVGPQFPMPIFRDIPAGTRLALFASNSGTNDSAYNGAIHAVV